MVMMIMVNCGQNRLFHRFEVNRKRCVRPATREEEAKFLLAYAKRELNDEKYDKLKKLLIGFLFRSVSTDDLISQSLDLVEGDKYLSMSFDYFFHKRPKIDPSFETQHNVDPIAMLMVKDEGEELIDKIEAIDSSTRKRFLNALNSSPLGAETLRKAEKLLGDSRLMKKSGHSAESSSKERNDVEEGNNILELDYSIYPRVTPSYVLPENDQVPKDNLPNKDSPLAALNRQCKSVASRETNSTFTTMHHNKYAEELFEVEDKRFELDVQIGSTESAIKRIEKRLKALEEKQTPKKDPLSGKDLKLIEFLYGDHGLEMIEALRTNEIKALPSILKRLKQKKKYLEGCCSALKVERTEVIVEKHKKALEHKSCHYCQVEKTPAFLRKLS
ncbi:hypothetical protein Sjap_015865 [Stephania japonica]|uniref:Histone deacetylase interacting domain-containing protein n=1 Tax=Stephania japonica TaxID=461633 RepID=A0AAP0NRS6_9MAGN